MVPSKQTAEKVLEAVRGHFTGDRDAIDLFGCGGITIARDGGEVDIVKVYRKGEEVMKVLVAVKDNADFVILAQDFAEIDAAMASVGFTPGY